MYASIRRYKGNATIADQLVKRRNDVETVIKGSPGFISYYLVKTNDGMVSVTVCESQNGAETSNRLAADWLKKNLPELAPQPPEIFAGEVAIQLSGSKTGMKA